MFGIGETELVIIVVFAFLLFGPDKLPGMGRTIGRVLRQFREASDGFTEVVQTNIMDPAAEELEKSPKQRKREEAEQAAQEDDGATGSQEAQEPAPRRETFAERKARLQAEREAAKKASAASDGNAADHASQDSAVAEKGSEQTDEGVSVADLYATGGQKSSRARAQESAEPAPAPTAAEPASEVATAAEPADAAPTAAEPEPAAAEQPTNDSAGEGAEEA